MADDKNPQDDWAHRFFYTIFKIRVTVEVPRILTEQLHLPDVKIALIYLTNSSREQIRTEADQLLKRLSYLHTRLRRSYNSVSVTFGYSWARIATSPDLQSTFSQPMLFSKPVLIYFLAIQDCERGRRILIYLWYIGYVVIGQMTSLLSCCLKPPRKTEKWKESKGQSTPISGIIHSVMMSHFILPRHH